AARARGPTTSRRESTEKGPAVRVLPVPPGLNGRNRSARPTRDHRADAENNSVAPTHTSSPAPTARRVTGRPAAARGRASVAPTTTSTDPPQPDRSPPPAVPQVSHTPGVRCRSRAPPGSFPAEPEGRSGERSAPPLDGWRRPFDLADR